MPMKQIISFILIILLVAVILLVTVNNADPVTFSYYISQFDIPLSLLLAFTLAIGAVMGVLATITMVLKVRRELRKSRRETKMKEQEILNLRAIPFKDKS